MAKRKARKIKFDMFFGLIVICAVLTIVSCFLPFVTHRLTSFIGDADPTNITGLDLMEQTFPDSMEDQSDFGMFALQLGGWASIIGGGALLLVLVVALLLPTIKPLMSVAKLLALLNALLSVLCLIGGIIVTSNTGLDLGDLAKYTITLNIGLFMYVIGGVGSCICAIMKK